MNIFVTGGAGYIGSATAEALLIAGHNVTIYDSLVTGQRNTIPTGAKFIHADISDADALGIALAEQQYDAIMHFAAFIDAGESMQTPTKYFRNNLVNSLQLIEMAAKANIKHFVLSSTAAIYKSSDSLLTEESALCPPNPYGYTKLAIEQALDWCRQIHGLHFAALRYFNAAGAIKEHGEAHRPESHLIPRVLKVALGDGEYVQIFGTDYPTVDGTCIRDYIHLADLVSAHLLTLNALTDNDRLIYNVGSGRGYSVREVIDAVSNVCGQKIPVQEKPRRPGDAARLVASAEKIKRELGWKPQYDNIYDIIASAWAWHKKHPNGYDER
jgi:UDP-glucose 4-epimerase